jgi:anaerobic ribonucleoside-triphosphate reductase activating protein
MKITNLYKNCAGPEGVQLDISFAGCEHECPGCYVPELWKPDMYPEWSDAYIFSEIKKLQRHVDKFALLGGDPLYPDNIDDAIRLMEHLQQYQKPITLITGYTREEISEHEGRETAFGLADLVITGRYDAEQRSDGVIGSDNQRMYRRFK